MKTAICRASGQNVWLQIGVERTGLAGPLPRGSDGRESCTLPGSSSRFWWSFQQMQPKLVFSGKKKLMGKWQARADGWDQGCPRWRSRWSALSWRWWLKQHPSLLGMRPSFCQAPATGCPWNFGVSQVNSVWFSVWRPVARVVCPSSAAPPAWVSSDAVTPRRSSVRLFHCP